MFLASRIPSLTEKMLQATLRARAAAQPAPHAIAGGTDPAGIQEQLLLRLAA